ncbi:MAG: hypothetical protein ACK5L6_02800, partial [Anaerorhabdus sp.]|uniref:hypothetical protein n=1 Tax=Anaerorhabdus sp. TaxID=1872524 RepID=UPI003A881B97
MSDIREDFPLRGAVARASCGTPLTAGWCKGKVRHYPYYFCRDKGCGQRGKSIARNKIEGAFETRLTQMQSSGAVIKVATARFRDCRAQQAAVAETATRGFKDEARRIQGKIEQLEQERLLLAEKAAR